jgi:hypothetical protein
VNGIIKCHFRKHITTDAKLRLHNIASKAALCYGGEKWIISKRKAQKLETAQIS